MPRFLEWWPILFRNPGTWKAIEKLTPSYMHRKLDRQPIKIGKLYFVKKIHLEMCRFMKMTQNLRITSTFVALKLLWTNVLYRFIWIYKLHNMHIYITFCFTFLDLYGITVVYFYTILCFMLQLKYWWMHNSSSLFIHCFGDINLNNFIAK